MSGCKCTTLTFLLVLCTLDSALAKTASPGVPPQPSQRASEARWADDNDQRTADLSESKDNVPTGLGSIPSVTQQVSPIDTGERARLAQTFLDGRLAVWQQRLNLEDWRISIILTRRNDLKAHTLGGIRWDKTKKTAVMSVLDPADYQLSFREMLDDMEFTIVHELVHLELASLPRSEASRSTEEHAVNGIADALLRLDHKK